MNRMIDTDRLANALYAIKAMGDYASAFARWNTGVIAVANSIFGADESADKTAFLKRCREGKPSPKAEIFELAEAIICQAYSLDGAGEIWDNAKRITELAKELP